MFKKLSRQEKMDLATKSFAKYLEDDTQIAVFENEKDRDSWVNDQNTFFERIAITFVELWKGADGKLSIVEIVDDAIDDFKWLKVPHKMVFYGF